ncbi:hypothetical protein [Cytobacillus kochii]|uniref:hypothetical protein n=1 Tax=Cytobacillus kochii TaxID=859143 RepID=UPI00402A9757
MPKKTQDNTVEEVIEPTHEEINNDTEIIETPVEIVEKKYVVVHDFKDLRDNNIIYFKGDIYPRRADSVIDEERIKELSSTNNKMKKILIKEQG